MKCAGCVGAHEAGGVPRRALVRSTSQLGGAAGEPARMCSLMVFPSLLCSSFRTHVQARLRTFDTLSCRSSPRSPALLPLSLSLPLVAPCKATTPRLQARHAGLRNKDRPVVSKLPVSAQATPCPHSRAARSPRARPPAPLPLDIHPLPRPARQVKRQRRRRAVIEEERPRTRRRGTPQAPVRREGEGRPVD